MNLFNFNLDVGSVLLPWRRKKPCVLVVEDGRQDALLISEAAKSQGFECEHATSGEAALGVLHKNGRHFTAMIVDVGLPYMSGWQLAQKVVQQWPHMPVILVSGAEENLSPRVQGDVFMVMLKSGDYHKLFRWLKHIARVR